MQNALVSSISTSELCTALEPELAAFFARPVQIIKLHRFSSPYRSSFALEELDVRLDDGTTLQLMFKHLSREALSEHARRAKPVSLYNSLREIQTYRAILAPNQLDTATYYGAVVDHQVRRYWLFLEKVPGLELYQVSFATWQQVARWLATMHIRFAGKTEQLTQVAPLLRYDADFYRQWMHRAQAFSRHARPSQLGAAQRSIEWLAERYDDVIEHLVTLPVTFIHGEFYASNVLVQETEGGLRICPIDWEMAAVGPGLIDLAALIAGTWNDEEKTALALAYYTALAPDDGWCSAPDAFLTALDCCRLHLAIQWLGWSPDWTPPPEHAQNWLSEALCLAKKLGL